MVAHRGEGVPNAANILIYGPPGTGKSEFVKTLATRLGLSAHFVGEHNGRDAEPNRQERIAALMIANALGADELEDDRRRGRSRRSLRRRR